MRERPRKPPNMVMQLTSTFAAQGVLRPPCSLRMLAAYWHVMRTSEPSHEPEAANPNASVDVSKSSVTLIPDCGGLDIAVHERGVHYGSPRDVSAHQRIETDEKLTLHRLLRPPQRALPAPVARKRLSAFGGVARASRDGTV